MIRLFVALNVPEKIKDKLLELKDTANSDFGDFRWEKRGNLHITAKFIGNVENSILPEIKSAISFINNYDAFPARIEKFGFFFKDKYPKILWMGLHIDVRIHKFVKELNSSLEPLSIPAEQRKFKAHITMLRINRKVDKSFIDAFTSFKFDPISFVFEDVSLMQSTLTPQGAVYKEIENYKLKLSGGHNEH